MTMPCSNTAALDRFEGQQVADEHKHERLAALAPESELMAECEDRMWQDFGFFDDLCWHHSEAVHRLALHAAGLRDLLPADYDDTQKIRDDNDVASFTRRWVREQYDGILQNWIEDNWHE